MLGNTNAKAAVSRVTVASATVANLGASDPSTVTFTKDTGFTTAGLGIETVTLDGDSFIKIPTMYRKVNTVVSNQITSYTISNSQVDNTYQPYPVFIAEDETTVLPYVLVGKYWNTSSSSMVSTTATISTPEMTIGTARTYARNRGTGYQQFDWMFWKLYQDLETCLAGTININSGLGLTYDALGIYWSTPACWVDGFVSNSATIAASNKPTQYVDEASANTTGYYGVSYSLPTTSNVISSLGYDANHPFVNVVNAVASSGDYSTYYCDFLGYATGSRPLTTSVGDSSAGAGAFCINVGATWSSSGSGARLCYRPLS